MNNSDTSVREIKILPWKMRGGYKMVIDQELQMASDLRGACSSSLVNKR
jgi:hypothetical protein